MGGHLDYSVSHNNHHTSKTEINHCHEEEDEKRELVVQFSEEEETLVAIMFALVGKRWSLIAGRIPGRTADEIQMYWKQKTE